MPNLNLIECCNLKLSGRIYSIGDNSYLVFSECPECGRAIAEIKAKNKQGLFITTLRRVGKAAERLYNKYGFISYSYEYKVHSGTKEREYNFYNDSGIIRNGNGVKVAKQDDFINMDRIEINTAINQRFYKSKIGKKFDS